MSRPNSVAITVLTFLQSPEAAVIQLFEEVKRHKPSVIYIPDVETWYHTLSESTIKTFTGLLRGIQPNEPVLLMGYMELQNDDQKPDPAMLRDLFGYSLKNQYNLTRPNEPEREEFFGQIIDMIRKSPKEFPDPSQRKRRKLADLPVAPPPQPKSVVVDKAAEKAQRRKDYRTLNKLKSLIQPVMVEIRKYRVFIHSPIDDSAIRYLYDEQDPNVLSTDLTEEQRQEQALFRPYEIDQDEKGVQGLRETASGKFYYNLNILVIEQRLANGYYKRPKDFLADIKRFGKDARTLENIPRQLKASELLTNVDVDMAVIEDNNPALMAECWALYEREQQRERERVRKAAEAKQKGENVPIVIPNVPPQHASHTTTEGSGPIVLGPQITGVRQPFPVTPSRLPGPSPISNDWSNSNGTSHPTNGSTAPSKPQDDSEMYDASPEFARPHEYSQQNTQGQRSQKSAHTHLAHGSQLNEYQNSASTTTSGQKTSDRSNRSSGPYSNNTQQSNGVRNDQDHPNFGAVAPTSGGSQLADTQEVHYQSSQEPLSQLSQPMGPPPHRASIHNLLNDPSPQDEPQDEPMGNYKLEDSFVEQLREQLVSRSSGLSVEQLEQVNAGIMDTIYDTREQWNRNLVVKAVSDTFNDTVHDIEACQRVLLASQQEEA